MENTQFQIIQSEGETRVVPPITDDEGRSILKTMGVERFDDHRSYAEIATIYVVADRMPARSLLEGMRAGKELESGTASVAG